MAPPKTRQVLGARQRAKDQALVVLQEEYDIRPRIASIPLAERDILGERIGKTRQQVTDWFRNRRTKEIKQRAANGQEPLDDEAEMEEPAAGRKDLVARPPADTAIYDLGARSVRIGFYSASRNYDGLCCWIDMDSSSLCYAVVSPSHQCLQQHITVPLSSIVAMRSQTLDSVSQEGGAMSLRFYLSGPPRFTTSIRSHSNTVREEQDWTRSQVEKEQMHEVLLGDGPDVMKVLMASSFRMLFEKEIPDAAALSPPAPAAIPAATTPAPRSTTPAPRPTAETASAPHPVRRVGGHGRSISDVQGHPYIRAAHHSMSELVPKRFASVSPTLSSHSSSEGSHLLAASRLPQTAYTVDPPTSSAESEAIQALCSINQVAHSAFRLFPSPRLSQSLPPSRRRPDIAPLNLTGCRPRTLPSMTVDGLRASSLPPIASSPSRYHNFGSDPTTTQERPVANTQAQP